MSERRTELESLVWFMEHPPAGGSVLACTSERYKNASQPL
jgi:hypothetical protein